MNKFKKYLRKFLKEMRNYKYTLIASLCFLLLIILLLGVYRFFMPANSDAKYGNRLQGIEEVEVDKSQVKTVVKALEKDEQIQSAKVSVDGKTVNVILTVTGSTSVDDAKKKPDLVISNFSDDQKKFFDFEVFIKSAEGKEGFPLIAYKNKSSAGFSF